MASALCCGAHRATLRDDDPVVPAGARGFVSLADGGTHLSTILVPIDREPDASGALETAARAAEALGAGDVAIELLHVGDTAPRTSPPQGEGWTWRRRVVAGNPVDVIVQTATESNADLVVMATAGHHGFLDALRGSTTEQVLRRAPCPLLAVPAR